MKESVNIRKAAVADYHKIYSYLVDEFGMDKARSILRKAIGAADWPPDCWIAEGENALVGIITTLNINGGIYVSPNYRRQGIGTTLMDVREQYFKQAGSFRTQMDVEITNTGLLALYSKYGYIPDNQSMSVLERAAYSGQSIADLERRPPTFLKLFRLY